MNYKLIAQLIIDNGYQQHMLVQDNKSGLYSYFIIQLESNEQDSKIMILENCESLREAYDTMTMQCALDNDI